MQAIDDRFRCVGRRRDARPGDHLEFGQAGFRNRGYLGKILPARLAGDGDPPHLAAAQMRHGERRGRHHEIDIAAEQAGHGGASPRYGTGRSCTPPREEMSSVVMWAIEPSPAVPDVMPPGLARAACSRSDKVLSSESFRTQTTNG